MSEDSKEQRMAQLDAKLAEAKLANQPTPRADTHYSQAHLAWRMVIELVVGIALGFGTGYGLDYLFGTLPIFLVLFTLVGMAAGVKTMLRSAQEAQTKNMAEQADSDERN